MFRAALLSALVVYASAQSLTTECTNALAGVATNPDAAACLSVGSLLPLASGGTNTSIISPINNWLTSLCGAAACSNATISAVVQNVTTGCATDLAATGFTPDMTSTVTTLIEQYYPTARKILCLKDGSTNCITETLTNIQNIVGTLSISNIITIGVKDGFSTIPSNVTCTDCAKAAYNVLKLDVPALGLTSTPDAVKAQCGAAFDDGSSPSSISQSANDGVATTSTAAASGAVSFLSTGALTGLGLSSLVVVSTIFTFFA